MLPSPAMSARWLLVVAGVAIAGGIAWLLIRSGRGPTISADRDAGVSQRGVADAARTATPTPPPPSLVEGDAAAPSVQPALPDSSPVDANEFLPLGADVWDLEPRDDAWAMRKERELDARLSRIDQRPGRVECRTNQCRLTFTGSEEGLSNTMAVLESTKGLQDVAQYQLFSLVRNSGGTMELRVYASFTR